MLPFAAWEASHTPFHVTAEALWAGAYLGVAVTVAGLFLWLHLLRKVPPRVAASVQYLQPVVGILAASLMFGDRLGPFFALGVLLILGGLGLAVATRRRHPEAERIERGQQRHLVSQLGERRADGVVVPSPRGLRPWLDSS